MFIALDSTGKRIDVADAEKGNDYFCPVCNNPLRIKEGNIKVKHFAHISKIDCDDFTTDMSEWHRKWQEQFPVGNREVVIEHNGEKHRADVLAYGHVIEFQHSPISLDEFERRNTFYTAAGKKVVWVFDLTEETAKKKILFKEDIPIGQLKEQQWIWNYSKYTFSRFLPQATSNVTLLFQFEPASFSNIDTVDYLKRVVWAQEESDRVSFHYFRTLPYPGTKNQLLEWIKNPEQQLQREKEQRKPITSPRRRNTPYHAERRPPQQNVNAPTSSDGLYSFIPAPTVTPSEHVINPTSLPDKEVFHHKGRITIDGVRFILCEICNEIFPESEIVDNTNSIGICRKCARKQDQ